MLQNINHLTLVVSEQERSIAFYHQLLGLRLHARWDSSAYLICGKLWLCLSVDGTRQFILPQESDYTHYAFSIAREE